MKLLHAVYFEGSGKPALLMPLAGGGVHSAAFHEWAFTDDGKPIPRDDGRMCRKPGCTCTWNIHNTTA